MKEKNILKKLLVWTGCIIFVTGGILISGPNIAEFADKTDQSLDGGGRPANSTVEPDKDFNEKVNRVLSLDKSDESLDGRWRPANTVETDNEFKEKMDGLLSLPYLQGYYKPPLKKGVTVYDRKLSYDGLNLYSSGHAEEAGIMDMNGNILHTWTFNVEKLLQKKLSESPNLFKEALTHWRRVHLYENGDILAIYEGYLMIKLDKDSNLLWVSKAKRPHHHMQTDEDGNIYVLGRKVRINPIVNKKDLVMEDFIFVLDPDGKVIKEYPLLDAFINSPYVNILKKFMRHKGELFHTNTLQLFDGKLSHISPLFNKGNVLISILHLNTIAIVNLEKNKVFWALVGHENKLWNFQHEPVLLENGNILIFDNDRREPGIQGRSRIVEFDPLTEKIKWMYQGDDEHPFYSRSCGTNQRLPNGNTLITESDNGRAFEVTRDGKIVWEFVTPHRAGENNELIATLLHVNRIDRSSLKWLGK